jgi:hypothetical protein
MHGFAQQIATSKLVFESSPAYGYMIEALHRNYTAAKTVADYHKHHGRGCSCAALAAINWGELNP